MRTYRKPAKAMGCVNCACVNISMYSSRAKIRFICSILVDLKNPLPPCVGLNKKGCPLRLLPERTFNSPPCACANPIYVAHSPLLLVDCFFIDLPWSESRKFKVMLCETSKGYENAKQIARQVISEHLEYALRTPHR